MRARGEPTRTAASASDLADLATPVAAAASFSLFLATCSLVAALLASFSDFCDGVAGDKAPAATFCSWIALLRSPDLLAWDACSLSFFAYKTRTYTCNTTTTTTLLNCLAALTCFLPACRCTGSRSQAKHTFLSAVAALATEADEAPAGTSGEFSASTCRRAENQASGSSRAIRSGL